MNRLPQWVNTDKFISCHEFIFNEKSMTETGIIFLYFLVYLFILLSYYINIISEASSILHTFSTPNKTFWYYYHFGYLI